MDGMLSQDEINALLAGMDLSGDSDVSQPAASEPESNGPREMPLVKLPTSAWDHQQLRYTLW